MNRVEKINELLKKNIAPAVNQEVSITGALITISNVDCSPNLSNAKVFISVLPENMAGTALEALRKKSGLIATTISKKIKLHRVPKFNWVFDDTEKNVDELEKVFQEIEQERLDKKSS